MLYDLYYCNTLYWPKYSFVIDTFHINEEILYPETVINQGIAVIRGIVMRYYDQHGVHILLPPLYYTRHFVNLRYLWICSKIWFIEYPVY